RHVPREGASQLLHVQFGELPGDGRAGARPGRLSREATPQAAVPAIAGPALETTPQFRAATDMESVDTIVIRAGAVGLAVAAELAARGFAPLVLEAESIFGSGISSRNSEVIHAGIYYPAGSLKARLCVEGRERLYHYCEANGVAHRRCGKLIVATDPAEHGRLAAVERAARANGVGDLRWLDAHEARALEPALACS